MRLASILSLCLALAACGTPPVDTERRAPRPEPTAPVPSPRSRPAPPPPARPAPPSPAPVPEAPAPEPPPPAPRASITLRSVYPEANLTEWELANGAHVLFERVPGEPLTLVAVAPGGTGGLEFEVGRAARAAAAARSTPAARAELGDVARRLVASGSAPGLGDVLRAVFDGSLAPTGAPLLPVEAAFDAAALQTVDGGARLFAEAFATPAAYTVAVVGDAEIEAVEGYVAGAFGAQGRPPLAFEPSAPFVPDSPEVVAAETVAPVATLIYRGLVRRGDGQAAFSLAAAVAAAALGPDATAVARVDAVSGTYEVAVRVGTGEAARVTELALRLATLAPPPELGAARREAARSGRAAAHHLLNWHARDGSPLRYTSFRRAVQGVSAATVAETLDRVFDGGAYRAVLGLDLTL